jgi:hypothetical protein
MKKKPINLFNKYTTYNRIYKNLSFDYEFELYYGEYKEYKIKLISITKLMIYKTCIYFMFRVNIYQINLQKSYGSTKITINSDCNYYLNECIDFSISDNKFHTYNEEKKIVIYEILDNYCLNFSKEASIDVDDKFDYEYYDAQRLIIFATSDYILLCVTYNILLFYNDLTLLKDMIVSDKSHLTIWRSIYVENNIIYLLNGNGIEIYKLS